MLLIVVYLFVKFFYLFRVYRLWFVLQKAVLIYVPVRSIFVFIILFLYLFFDLFVSALIHFIDVFFFVFNCPLVSYIAFFICLFQLLASRLPRSVVV